ncbi:MAG: HAMP domain-containing histidine kinase [Deltaproteobacteria bacterium]|nr:HAMP domain-containing histidine kinase [Deltaproteobacteria bacterium]
MNEPRWFFHPVLILVLSILALAGSLFLYIYWYVGASSRLKALARRMNVDPSQFTSLSTWVVILVLSILVGIIFLGIFLFFVYTQKSRRQARMQRNFINNFTHELKTPVTSLKLYLETFSRHQLSPEETQRYLGYMVSDVRRLSDNVNRILNLARIEGKSFKEPFVLEDPMRLTREFAEKNKDLFPELSVHLPEKDSKALCRMNKPLFDMLLSNLFSNAVKYAGDNPPRLDVALRTDKKRVVLDFADRGLGLEKKDLKRVFKKFYQAGDPSKAHAMGTGLGLYLVKSIVGLHKGKIKAQSPGPGKGTVFTLVLPVARENKRSRPKKKQVPAESGERETA